MRKEITLGDGSHKHFQLRKIHLIFCFDDLYINLYINMSINPVVIQWFPLLNNKCQTANQLQLILMTQKANMFKGGYKQEAMLFSMGWDKRLATKMT